MLKELVISVQSYFRAHDFIQKHRMWKWIIVPGIIYALVFVVSIYFFSKSMNQAIQWLTLETGLQTWVNRLQGSMIGFLFTLGGVMLWLLLLLLYFSLFKYIWLIIGSPVFSYLSEKTASVIEGKTNSFSFMRFLSDLWRGITMALRNTFWQLIFIIAIIFVSLIPVIGWITPILAVIIECYYYGFSMLDYTCERNGMNKQKSIDYISTHKGLAIGNGIVFYLMHLLPIIGWVLAPAYAVVAATISLHEMRDDHHIS